MVQGKLAFYTLHSKIMPESLLYLFDNMSVYILGVVIRTRGMYGTIKSCVGQRMCFVTALHSWPRYMFTTTIPLSLTC